MFDVHSKLSSDFAEALEQFVTDRILSLRFDGHFPGGSVLAGTRVSPFWILLKLRVMEVVVTTGAIRRTKLQSNRHQQQTNTQLYRPDALPVTQPTESEH